MGEVQLGTLEEVLNPVHYVMQPHKIKTVPWQDRRATVPVPGVSERGRAGVNTNDFGNALANGDGGRVQAIIAERLGNQ